MKTCGRTLCRGSGSFERLARRSFARTRRESAVGRTAAQLAGTTIYSREDLLLPPHIVAPGDTLQTIAEPLSVPWQLLAKINGVDDPDKLVQGEAIKLVRGPFDAIVSVSRRRLTLQVGGNYAGGFLVGIGRDVQQRIGSSFAVVSNRKGNTGNNPAVQQVTLISEMPSPAVIALSGVSSLKPSTIRSASAMQFRQQVWWFKNVTSLN